MLCLVAGERSAFQENMRFCESRFRGGEGGQGGHHELLGTGRANRKLRMNSRPRKTHRAQSRFKGHRARTRKQPLSQPLCLAHALRGTGQLVTDGRAHLQVTL